MALTELDMAREIAIIGFVVIFVTLGVLVIVITTIGGRALVKKILDSIEQ